MIRRCDFCGEEFDKIDLTPEAGGMFACAKDRPAPPVLQLRPVDSDEHVRDAVEALEEALADAKAGKLAWVIVYGNVRGEGHLKSYKGSCADRLSIAGMLSMALHDLCREK